MLLGNPPSKTSPEHRQSVGGWLFSEAVVIRVEYLDGVVSEVAVSVAYKHLTLPTNGQR